MCCALCLLWPCSTNPIHVIDVRRVGKVDPYLAACKSLGIVPSSYFASNYNSGCTEILMRYHGIGPKGAQAIAEVLKLPNSVFVKLDLAVSCSNCLHLDEY